MSARHGRAPSLNAHGGRGEPPRAEVSIERYTSGLENFLSVVDEQRTVYAADDALVESERNRALSMIAVYKALGGGWQPHGTAHRSAATNQEQR